MEKSRQRALYLHAVMLILYGFVNLLIPWVMSDCCKQFDLWRISGIFQLMIGGFMLNIAKWCNSSLHQATLSCNRNLLAVLIYIMYRSENYMHQFLFYQAIILLTSLMTTNVVHGYFSHRINMTNKSKQREYTQRLYQSIQKLRSYLKY